MIGEVASLADNLERSHVSRGKLPFDTEATSTFHGRDVGPFKIVSKRGDLAYQLELPSNFANVHDVFHVSQLRKCFKTPDRTVNFEDIELQEDLSYREHPVAILEETERKTRNKSIKFLKVKWSHHSDHEATWECEDLLRSEYPAFFQSLEE